MKLGGELRGTYVHLTRPGFHKVQFVGLSSYVKRTYVHEPWCDAISDRIHLCSSWKRGKKCGSGQVREN